MLKVKAHEYIEMGREFSRWFIEFLDGATAHPNGMWFGEKAGKATYWWRKELHAFATPPTKPEES